MRFCALMTRGALLGNTLASKAFDRVNHSKLFDTLVKRGGSSLYNQNNAFLVYQSDNVCPLE